MLSEREQVRYTRHLLLKQIGGAGQAKLKQAKVLVVGAGGLGAPCLFYLAASGVGTIGIIDDDIVALSNLQRQILYTTDQLGKPKVECAKAQLAALNPEIKINQHFERLTPANGLAVIQSYDFIADGSDNFATRFLVNDICYFAKRPLITAALGGFLGQLATFRAYEKDESNNPNPSWRCFAQDKITDAADCEQGILGALCGVMGSLQALEIIKQITGAGDSLLNKLLLYDGLSTTTRTIKLKWDKTNPLNGQTPTINLADFC